MDLFFKLFNNIKSEHEAQVFARLELESLVGRVEPVGSVLDLALRSPFGMFMSASFGTGTERLRVADALTYELPYGKTQGYTATVPHDVDLIRLAKRLGYTREIYALVAGNSSKTLHALVPEGTLGRNVQVAVADGHSLLRVITHQFYFEKSEYISRLSRDEKEVEANLKTLLAYLCEQAYRVPATATMRVGRRLEDWFAIREEPSLYLTHYMYPYKGKFHPKMARALLNYIWPHDEGTVLDNFAGSGTSLAEAIMMGLNAQGVEVNPLSVLMTNAKCDCLSILKPSTVREQFERSMRQIVEIAKGYEQREKGQRTLSLDYDWKALRTEVEELRPRVLEYLKNGQGTVEKAVISRHVFSEISDPHMREFLLLVLSGTVSDVARRTSADFLEAMVVRFANLYLRVYLIDLLKDALKVKVGHAEAFVGDTRNMREVWGRNGKLRELPENSIDAIVNSPPYSTALDYIENDYPQLVLLDLQPPLEVIREKMMGAPKGAYDETLLVGEFAGTEASAVGLPKYARGILKTLMEGGRRDAAVRAYKFFLDMRETLREMFRVLRPGSKAAIVIGNNRYKLADESHIECENDRAILEMGLDLGFQQDQWLAGRDLEKSSVGAIRYESVVVLKKPG